MKNQQSNDSVFNKKLQEAFLFNFGSHHDSQLIENAEQLRLQNDPNEFPESLDKWFEVYIEQFEDLSTKSKIRKNIFTHRFRIAIIAIAFLSCAILMSFNSTAFKMQISQLFIKSTETHSDIYYSDKMIKSDYLSKLPSDWSNFYYLTVLPMDYTFSNALSVGNIKYLIFNNDDKNDLIFIQCDLNTSVLIDSENTTSYETDINGIDGIIYEKEDLTTLIWADNSNSFYLIGDIEKEIMVDIASTLHFKKK